MRLPWSVFALVLLFARADSQPWRFDPVFRNYTTDQGLPHNYAYGIQQDRQGYIWVATDAGVCRFDGHRFQQFPDTLYANQTSVLSRSMMEDAGGRMWWMDFQNHVF